jgi:hypothetical protein
MRITVDISDETLEELSRMTGETVNEYIKRQKAKEFGKLLREGAFDYPATNDEIEKSQG